MIGRRQLEDIRRSLSGREREVLRTVSETKLITTGLIGRLHFTGYATPSTGKRLARLTMNKLCKAGLVKSINNRFRSGKQGSSENIWALTEPGYRLLSIDETNAKRKRFREGATASVNHTLAIAACYTEICEHVRADGLTLLETEFEDRCWRRYKFRGKNFILKPDLFFRVESEEYVDNFFLEVDLATEAISVVKTKCERYHQYRSTNIERERLGGFPLVIWLVPDERRKNLIARMLTESFSGQQKMFLVILPNELRQVVQGNIDNFTRY